MSNLKKHRKNTVGVIAAAIISSALLIIAVIAEDGKLPKISDNASIKQEESMDNDTYTDQNTDNSSLPGSQENVEKDGQDAKEAKAKEQDNINEKANEQSVSDVASEEPDKQSNVVYENNQYGFSFYLPATWQGYSIVEEQWEGMNGEKIVETGPKLLIRHPDWTETKPRQDIPIMIFTTEQWNALQNGEFPVSAAPIGPSILGSNSSYVFALPARYNYAFPTGFEEVEEILKNNPLKTSEDVN